VSAAWLVGVWGERGLGIWTAFQKHTHLIAPPLPHTSTHPTHPPPNPTHHAATDVRFPAARDAVVALIKETMAASGGASVHTLQIKNVPHGKRD